MYNRTEIHSHIHSSLHMYLSPLRPARRRGCEDLFYFMALHELVSFQSFGVEAFFLSSKSFELMGVFGRGGGANVYVS